MRRWGLCVGALVLAGCAGDAELVAPEPPPCPSGELLVPDGSCIRPGIRPDQCPTGFTHDGDRGCEPILPAEDCPPGLMAVPGETTCREVAPCGDGPWGDVPVEPGAQHVDGSYAGGDSDGSATRPWQRIQDGVDAAAPGSQVVVAAGSYSEAVVVLGKSVRLWGRCPSLVELVGPVGEVAALVIADGGDGSEVHRLAVRGAEAGVLVTEAAGVVLDRLWIHDTLNSGLAVQPADGVDAVHVTGSLFETIADVGLFLSGAEVVVEDSVVRDAGGDAGSSSRGIAAQASPSSNEGASLTLRGSLVDRSRGRGVYVSGSTATLEATVIRNTEPDGDGADGVGVYAMESPTVGLPANLTANGVLIDQNRMVGLLALQSVATVDRSVIRNTLPAANGFAGRGADVESLAVDQTAQLTLSSCLVEGNTEYGVFVGAAAAIIDSSVVRDTSPTVLPGYEGIWGQGVHVKARDQTSVPATLQLSGSLIERNRETSVTVVSSAATIATTVVRDTRVNDLDAFGDGVVVVSLYPTLPASAALTGVHVDGSARASVASFGATVALAGLRLTCGAIDVDGETMSGTDFVIDDQGDNRCGCPEATDPCVVSTLGLDPPQAP